jgi:HAD superfamily hydrolase (TIGR01509 family)
MIHKAVIFDLDGTLIDSMLLWRRVDHEFLNKRGVEVPSDLFDHLPQGNSFIQTAQYFRDRFGLQDSVQSIMQEWTDMVSWHYSHDVQLKPGAEAMVKGLKKAGIPVALGTSNSMELAQKVLTLNGIWQLFDAVVTGDMHLMGKPFPDIYLKAAALLGVEPGACIVVEDTITGTQAAKSAGMTAFAIYDDDSVDMHPQIKGLCDGFYPDYNALATGIAKLLDIDVQVLTAEGKDTDGK